MKIPLFIVAGLLTAVTGQAATVNWSSTIDTGFAVSTGIALTQGNYVRLGYFTLSDASIQALASPTGANIATLDAAFKAFDSSTIGTGTSEDGLFSKSSSVLYSSVDAAIPNAQIYIWALRATNNSSLSSALSTAYEQAILYMPYTPPPNNDADWRFPANDVSSTTVDIADVHVTGGKFLVGSYQSSNASLSGIFGGPAGAVVLQDIIPIPEPSSLFAGLLLTAVAAGVRRRRRE